MTQPSGIPAGMLESLTNPEVNIGETRFYITALLPMEGFDVLEEIREVAITPSGLQAVLENPTQEGMAMMLLAIVSALPKRTVKSVQNQMFKSVTFTNANYQTPRMLQGSESHGFMGLTPFDVYNITIRCLAINFLESSQDFLSRILQQAPTTPS